MKVTPRFNVRAALVLAAAGVIGVFGACKKEPVGPPPPPVPPPPPLVSAPTGLSATTTGATTVALAWTDNANNETGYRVERCSGAGCTNFAQVGVDLAANTVAFDDVGLALATSYSYRVRAFNATASSDFSNTGSAITESPPVPGQVMIGAGEITSCLSPGASQTATLVQNQIAADPNTIVFTIGNNLADSTTATRSYTTCFDPSWGRFRAGLRPAVGNFDYASVGEDAVYSYFGDRLPANGWYAFDAGASWRVIVLNTATWEHGVGNIVGPSPMLDFLNNELAANTKPCVMVISWERRIYTSTSGTMGKNQNMEHIVQAMYAAGADILLSAKDKQYMRFPKTDDDGIQNAAGFAQFVVGTGGRSLDLMHAPAAGNPVAAQFGGRKNPDDTPIPDSWGVVKFTLHANSYDWAWVGTNPSAFSDSGTQACN